MSGIELNNQQRKYVPHLPSLLAVCEMNYSRLLRLLPDCDSVDLCYKFGLNSYSTYEIVIVESSRYTSTIEFTQLNKGMPDYLKPVMQVRLYHDAQMAEVISSQNFGAFKPSYQYPNSRMHQRNEKEMVNRFLAEWLSFCLQQKNKQQAPQA